MESAYGTASPFHNANSSSSSSSTSNNFLAAQQQHRYRASPTGMSAPTQQYNSSQDGSHNGNSRDAIGRGTVHDPYGLDYNGGGGSGGGGGAGGLGGLPMPATAASQSGWGAGFARPARSHYFLSRSEIVKGVANRFVHSTAYLYFYGGMAVASLLTVVLSLIQDCPGTLFYSLELAINVLLIAEVGVRLFAFGKQFWKSTFNIIDLCLVIFCAITLLVIFFSHDCSPERRSGGGGRYGTGFDGDQDDYQHHGDSGGRGGRSEELLDSVLLIIRNAMQCFRLVSVVRRSRQNVNSRVANIDLSSAQAARGADADLYGYDYGSGGVDGDQPYGTARAGGRPGGIGGGGSLAVQAARFSLDIDLQDEGALARERMADGGDPAERKRRAERERWRTGSGDHKAADEHRALFDANEDDDDDDEEL
ncbi:hypothetical protein OC845_004035 [Tilletia horrida]|nr:hypothetical protein OC845_004035 [Tilletia horrida]